MRRLASLLLAALMLVPISAAQEGTIVEGEYPDAVRAEVGSVIEEAPEQTWAPGIEGEQPATKFLDEAERQLEEGNLSLAVENYLLYHVTTVGNELTAQARERSAPEGQDHVDDVLTSIRAKSEASYQTARTVFKNLNVENLTRQGLDTALWGAILVAEGRMQNLFHDQKVPQNVYDAGTVNRSHVLSRVGPALGGRISIELGIELASVAPLVGGDALDEDAAERVGDLANRSIPVPDPQVPDYIPRAKPSDSALLRSAMVHVTEVEIKVPQFKRIYRAPPGPALIQSMANALELDHENLKPYAEENHPLAKVALEGIAITNPAQLEDPARRELQRAHAIALIAGQTEEALYGNVTEQASENEAPAPGAVMSFLGLACVALAVRRRRH